MHIELVGPGRVGRTLAPRLQALGHAVHLRGRGEPIDGRADVVWLTVPDSAIAHVAPLVPSGPLVAHASGVSGLDVLAPHDRRASLHPLMSFPGPEIAEPDLAGVPAAVDAVHPADRAQMEALARALGLDPVHVPGDRRLYHAAAVIAGNLATVLLAEAGRVLTEAGVPAVTARRMLAPLAHASLEHAIADPRAALTGPVARGDTATLALHRDALHAHGLDDVIPMVDDGTARAARIRDGGE